jgi:hypothetical protein
MLTSQSIKEKVSVDPMIDVITLLQGDEWKHGYINGFGR